MTKYRAILDRSWRNLYYLQFLFENTWVEIPIKDYVTSRHINCQQKCKNAAQILMAQSKGYRQIIQSPTNLIDDPNNDIHSFIRKYPDITDYFKTVEDAKEMPRIIELT